MKKRSFLFSIPLLVVLTLLLNYSPIKNAILNSLTDLQNVSNVSNSNANWSYSDMDLKNVNGVGQFTITWVGKTGGQEGSADENDKSLMVGNPAQNTTDGVKVTYQLMVNTGGSRTAKPGEIQIKIPRYIYYGREDNPVSQKLDIPLAQYPEKKGTGFNYRFDKDENGEDIIILENYQDIPASYSFECSMTWTLTTPSSIADGYQKKISGDVIVDFDNDGKPDLYSKSNELTFKYFSHAAIRSVYNSAETHTDSDSGRSTNVYQTWQSSWPKELKPENDTDYVYAIWRTEDYVYYATQPYSQTITSKVTDNNSGETVGFTSGKVVHEISTNSSPSSNYNNYYYYYAITKYPKSVVNDGETHTLSNEAVWALTGVDGATDEKSASASISYKYEIIEPSEKIVYTSGIVPIPSTNNRKYGGYYCGNSSPYYCSSNYYRVSGGINLLEKNTEQDVLMGYTRTNSWNYINYASLQYYYLTLKEGGNSADLNDYGVTNWKYNLIDDTVILGNDTKGYEQLTDDDYEFINIGISDYSISDFKDTTTTSYNSSTKVTTKTIGWQAVSNSNYETYPEVKLYYKKDGNWLPFGTVKKLSSSSYEYTDLMNESKTISSSSRIELPTGTTGIKGEVETNEYSVSLNLYSEARLKNTEHVKNIIKEQDEVYLYNFGTSYAEDKEGNIYSSSANRTLSNYFKELIESIDNEQYGKVMGHDYDYNIYTRIKDGSTQTNKSVIYSNDPVERRVKADYTAYAYERATYNNSVLTYNDVFDLNILTEQRNGTFYDLLPIGMTVDLDSVKVTGYGNSQQFEIKKSLIDNYKNTGRTMLIVSASAPEDFENYNSTYYSGSTYYARSGMQLTFTGYYSWDNIYDYGNNLLNTIAYQSGDGTLSSGYADDASTMSVSSLRDKDLFVDLNEDGNPEGTIKNTVYAQTQLAFSFNTASESAFKIGVKTTDMTDYVVGNDNIVTTSGGGYYTYKLRYASQKNVKTTGLVIYDVLEVFKNPSDINWKGKFVNLDLSQIEEKGIKPVVYYSTTKDLDLYEYGKASIDMGTPKNADLSNTAIWSTTPPKDLGDVTAIAIDLSKDVNGNDYTLEPEDSVLAILTMQAPAIDVDVLGELNAKALNAAWWSGTTKQGTEPEHYNFSVYENTVVVLSELKVKLDKSSYIESGTAETPAIVKVGDEIVYDLTIENTSTFETLKDIKVLDKLPDTVNLKINEISYYIEGSGSKDDSILINSSDFVKSELKENDLTLIISQLYSGQKIHLLVPTKVKNNGSNDTIIKNTAYLNEFNGTPTDLVSKATYHKANYGNIKVSKQVKGKGADKDKEFEFTITLTKPEDIVEDEKNNESSNEISDNSSSNSIDNSISEEVSKLSDEVEIIEDISSNNTTEQPNDNNSEITDGTNVDNIEDAIVDNTDPLNSTYSGIEFVNGIGSFKLKDGESKLIENIPEGYNYEIKEMDYISEGYETKSNNEKGVIEKYKTKEVKFVNTYVKKMVQGAEEIESPTTLDNIVKYVFISLVSFIALFVGLVILKKRKGILNK